ncbi:ABC transporter ATP-binding protein [uncultured Vagococcus sp.]|uniref:ABC transporter ATP-binding protein n=1 Tax=uncultured Vagococcus sp. TaxID=189676 RepID=UPI0028D32CDC|nr:ABC transporter ATP-binding protein [uncultured Vagococcus sp.]
MNSIEFIGVTKTYGDTIIINDLDLAIRKGERMILLGPSGCGKSTLLRLISGLETVSSGQLLLNGEVVNEVDSGDRSIAMVFQNYALFPHMTVKENIGYGLRINKVPRSQALKQIGDAIEILGLEGLEERLPKDLSGGQRQRVALARGVVKRADFFLLDEPLSNLDAQLRGQARKELVNIHELYGQTFVYVTHDQIEAMTIGDRIALLNEGVLQMLDTPHNVYHRPANIFTAKFIGSPSMNIMEVALEGIHLKLGSEAIPLPEDWQAQLKGYPHSKIKMGIRPEDVRLTKKAGNAAVPITIKYVEDYGNRVGYYFDVEAEMIGIIAEKRYQKGEQVYWRLTPQKWHFFDSKTNRSLGYPVTWKERS